VVATLVYLSLQVRQNSKLARATIRETRTDSSQKVIFAMADASDILSKPQDELTVAENAKLKMLFRGMFRDFEAYSYQHHAGLLDETEWIAMHETWRDIMSSARNRAIWKEYEAQYSTILHEDLKEILSKEATQL